MASMDEKFERGAQAARKLIETVLVPWGGSAACIEAYEDGIRAATDLQFTLARTLELEPVGSSFAAYANLMRDIGATQVSSARWILDV